MSKHTKLAEALLAGGKFTAKQIKEKFGIVNARSATTHLRQNHGISVLGNKISRTGAVQYSVQPVPRAVVAAGFQVLAGSSY